MYSDDEGSGLDFLGAEDVMGDDVAVTVPTVGAVYTDAKTVAAVQQALVKKGYDCGDTGPNKDGVDGQMGPATKKAINKMKKDLGQDQTGQIDTQVIMALQVTPGVLPPGVTLAGRAAVQAQAALDAATAAEHAVTPQDVQKPAQDIQQVAAAAAPPLPPDVQKKVDTAVADAKKAKTPDDAKKAGTALAAVAAEVHAAVKPSWWSEPAWPGAPERWKVGAAASAVLGTIGGIVWAAVGGRSHG